MINNLKSKSGMSLIEIIIAVSLFAIIGTPIIIGVINTSRLDLSSKDVTNANIIGEQVCEKIVDAGVIDDGIKQLNGRNYRVIVQNIAIPDPEIDTGSYQEERGVIDYWSVTQSGQTLTLQKYVNNQPVGTLYSVNNNIPDKSLITDGFSIVFYDDKVRFFVDTNELALENSLITLNERTLSIKINMSTSVSRVNLYNVMTNNTIENVYYDSDLINKNKFNINYDKNILLADANDIPQTLDEKPRTENKYNVQIYSEDAINTGMLDEKYKLFERSVSYIGS